MPAIKVLRPMPTMAIMMARPACVPATLAKPAREPWRMLLASLFDPPADPSELDRLSQVDVVAGVAGNGQAELMRSLAGLQPSDGAVYLEAAADVTAAE